MSANWYDPVAEEDALTVKCPFCQSPRGTMCVYTAPYGKIGGQYVVGQPCKRTHWQRREVVRARRWREFSRDNRPVTPATLERRQAAAAEREFDRREWEKLRTWLHLYGEIFWRPARPDGTFRGDSYAFEGVLPEDPTGNWV